jgi:hypothetical protein
MLMPPPSGEGIAALKERIQQVQAPGRDQTLAQMDAQRWLEKRHVHRTRHGCFQVFQVFCLNRFVKALDVLKLLRFRSWQTDGVKQEVKTSP